MNKEKYLQIRKLALEKRNESTKNNNQELLDEATYLSNILFKDKNEKEIFINNFILPNNKLFLEKRIEFSKNSQAMSKALNVPFNIIISKLGELSIYEQFIIDELETEKKELH